MYKSLKILGVLVVVASATGHANASTLQEDFVFSWSTNGSFNLSNLSYSSTSSGNLLSPGLSPYTTSVGGTLPSGSGHLSEIISVDTTQSYTTNYSVSNFTGNLSSFAVSVSPVPLPAGFPLFALALLSLGLLGCHSMRTNSRVAA